MVSKLAADATPWKREAGFEPEPAFFAVNDELVREKDNAGPAMTP